MEALTIELLQKKQEEEQQEQEGGGGGGESGQACEETPAAATEVEAAGEKKEEATTKTEGGEESCSSEKGSTLTRNMSFGRMGSPVKSLGGESAKVARVVDLAEKEKILNECMNQIKVSPCCKLVLGGWR